MKESHAILVTHCEPSDVGHGGNHRAFQILHDLKSAVGRDHIILVNFAAWRASTPETGSALVRWGHKLRRRIASYAENPAKLRVFAPYYTRLYCDPAFLRYYSGVVQQATPAFCIIEHTGFSDVIRVNSSHGIPTWACPANLESFDSGFPTRDFSDSRGIRTRAIDFGNEVEILRRCSERLFISKVEAGAIGGLGLRSRYYPYLPVGEIRQRLDRIREARSERLTRRGVFVVLGSARHRSTRDAFEWFLCQARASGLPDGVHVIFAGAETDQLRPEGAATPQIEFRGELSQEALDKLLISAGAVLIPQFWGFGAVTRVAEMACGGVPILVSRHAALAMDVPPGVKTVKDSWKEWYDGMVELYQSAPSEAATCDEYLAWEQAQPRAIAEAINGYTLA